MLFSGSLPLPGSYQEGRRHRMGRITSVRVEHRPKPESLALRAFVEALIRLLFAGQLRRSGKRTVLSGPRLPQKQSASGY